MIENNSINGYGMQIIRQDNTPDNKREIGSVDMILNQFPALFGAENLSKAYKLVFPVGVSGHLMEIKNGINAGLNTTSVIGNNSSKIVAQAGLQSLSSVATPLAVFSVMSMVTGQYFMAEINKSITALSQNIEKLQRRIDISQEGIVFSACVFLQEIRNDWNLILSSESFKAGIVSNLLKVTNDLAASCYYFETILNDELGEFKKILDKNKLAEKELLNKIEQDKNFLKNSYELRNCLRMILIYLTTEITRNNAIEINETINRDEINMFSSTVEQLNEKIDSIIPSLLNAPKEKLQNQAEEAKNTILAIRFITRDRYNDDICKNIKDTIDKIASVDDKGQSFFIENGKLYIEEAA